jgi:hypothetical protein
MKPGRVPVNLARIVPLGTVAVAVAACIEVEPQTPSDFAWSGESDPQMRTVVMPRREDLHAQWQLPPDSPWMPYQKWTLPSALDQTGGVRELPDVGSLQDVAAARLAALRIGRTGLPIGTMWVVDLRGAASVAFGSQLSRVSDRSVAIVPTFNNWPADNELVPAEETLAAMIAMPPRPAGAGATPSVPVFLLDAWRLAYKKSVIDETVMDNRYMLNGGDFPPPDTLRSNGITRVVYVVQDRELVASEEDDLNVLFQSYGDAGIEIDMVDVASFAGEGDAGPTAWSTLFDANRLLVSPRVTVVGDERFYQRARGGFGGIHARPVVIGHGFVGGFGGGHSSAGGG